MDTATLLIIAIVALPTLPALLNGSIVGVIISALIGFAAAWTIILGPWGIALWLLAWIVSWSFGAGRAKRRRSEQQHRELLAAIAKGQQVEPPKR